MNIFQEFKKVLTAQIVEIITIGFIITSIFNNITSLITKNEINLQLRDFIFIFLSFISMFLTSIIKKEKIIIYKLILKFINNFFNSTGFITLFIPIILLIQIFIEQKFDYLIIINCLVSIIISNIIFFLLIIKNKLLKNKNI